jgi:hypothetical protein
MKKILINYANKKYYHAQKKNSETGKSVGGFDEIKSYGVNDIDPQFSSKNQHILNQSRGAGYWLWKPYFIVKTLESMQDGDLLFYADSGSHFINNINPVIEVCKTTHNGILLFTLEDFHTHKKWTKRDCFYYMGLDTEPYLSVNQILASFIVCIKNANNIQFFKEWLTFAEDSRIITDDPNVCGLGNYPEFKDHRHDQSILSLLGRKHKITTIPDISQWGNDRREKHIPQILEHTRSNL